MEKKTLRKGYTTGTCAAAAAKAAALMLFERTPLNTVTYQTPGGVTLHLRVRDVKIEEGRVRCAIQKDSGDDPDVTNGMRIFAQVSKNSSGIFSIDGGEGIGRVTRPGLDAPVGEAAINAVPKAAIQKEVLTVCEKHGYIGGMDVLISAPGGQEIALRTFNARLGVVGGISILGTTGIVEPMSESAMGDALCLEIRQKALTGSRYLMLTPGSIGALSAMRQFSLKEIDPIKCGNFIGESLTAAAEAGIKGVLLAGHIGKLVKLAGGIMNTHSRYGDCRMELLTAHAALAGGDHLLLHKLMSANTTDEATGHLKAAGLLEPTLSGLIKKMLEHIAHAVQPPLTVDIILFDKSGFLACSDNAEALLERICTKKNRSLG